MKIAHASRISLLLFLAGLVMQLLVNPAQAYYFGRNKVHYSAFSWKTMETEHFEIFYYEEAKELATIAAQLCEESYADLTLKFKDHPKHKTPLIVYSSHIDFQQTNVTSGPVSEGVAGFTEFLKGRVLIHHNGSYHDLKHLVQHELVHVFMLATLNHSLSDHHKMRFNLPPLWFVEGLAEYWSAKWDAQGEMIIRDYAINDQILDLASMWRMQGFHIYKLGQLFLHFTAETYGEEKILQIFKNWWKSDNFEEVTMFTFGEPYTEVSKKWVYWLKKRYFPIIATTDVVDHVAEELTMRGYADMKPAVVPGSASDVDTIIFLANRTGYTNIYQINTRQREAKVKAIVKGERNKDYESFHQFRSRIHINRKKELAFISKAGEKDQLYIHALRDNQRIKSFSFDELITLSSPNWSPDGQRIIFNGIDREGYSDLFIVDAKTGHLEQITLDFYDDQTPAWSPDGKTIVFSSDRVEDGISGTYNLFALDLESRDIRQITFGHYKDMAPAWSSDGRRLAFSSDRNGVFNLFVADVKTSADTTDADSSRIVFYEPQRISNFLTAAIDPVWTNDNSRLIFSAYNESRLRLYTVKVPAPVDTARTIEEVAFSPSWQPKPIADYKSTIKYSEYTPRFSLDVAQGAVGYEPDPSVGNGGMVLALSDMLGDHFILMSINNSAKSRSDFLRNLSLGATYVNRTHRLNWGAGGFHFVGDYYDAAGHRFYERMVGVTGLASYPISKFRRFDFSTVLKYSDRENYTSIIDDNVSVRDEQEGYYATNYISYVKDTSLWEPVGPIDGQRFNATVGLTTDLTRMRASSYVLMGDWRKYFRLSTNSAIATRLMGRYSDGKDPEIFHMGGSWTLRGYPRNSISGNYLLLLNNELRFPILHNAVLSFPFGNMEFFMLRGAIFFDVGNCWVNKVDWDMKGSFGLGLRLNVFGAMVLRWDFARRTDFNNISKDTYREFFFGWNF